MIDIKKLTPGWIHAPLDIFYKNRWEPELNDILAECPAIENLNEWTLDVKVHMLMPGQWPCIPNWHYDNVPRDDEGNQLMSARDPDQIMWIWVSGHPLPEFEFGEIPVKEWIPFTQFDSHRGTMSKEHTWRLFMRITPRTLLPPRSIKREDCVRRHSQVYLDAENFKW